MFVCSFFKIWDVTTFNASLYSIQVNTGLCESEAACPWPEGPLALSVVMERAWLQCLGQKRQRLPALEPGRFRSDLDLLSVCGTGVRLG